MDLNHDFCAAFRADLKRYGLQQVITELVTSSSPKVPLKKQYLARECRKTSFAAKFETALNAVGENNRNLKPAIFQLRQEIIGAVK